MDSLLTPRSPSSIQTTRSRINSTPRSQTGKATFTDVKRRAMTKVNALLAFEGGFKRARNADSLLVLGEASDFTVDFENAFHPVHDVFEELDHQYTDPTQASNSQSSEFAQLSYFEEHQEEHEAKFKQLLRDVDSLLISSGAGNGQGLQDAVERFSLGTKEKPSNFSSTKNKAGVGAAHHSLTAKDGDPIRSGASRKNLSYETPWRQGMKRTSTLSPSTMTQKVPFEKKRRNKLDDEIYELKRQMEDVALRRSRQGINRVEERSIHRRNSSGASDGETRGGDADDGRDDWGSSSRRNNKKHGQNKKKGFYLRLDTEKEKIYEGPAEDVMERLVLRTQREMEVGESPIQQMEGYTARYRYNMTSRQPLSLTVGGSGSEDEDAVGLEQGSDDGNDRFTSSALSGIAGRGKESSAFREEDLDGTESEGESATQMVMRGSQRPSHSSRSQFAPSAYTVPASSISSRPRSSAMSSRLSSATSSSVPSIFAFTRPALSSSEYAPLSSQSRSPQPRRSRPSSVYGSMKPAASSDSSYNSSLLSSPPSVRPKTSSAGFYDSSRKYSFASPSSGSTSSRLLNSASSKTRPSTFRSYNRPSSASTSFTPSSVTSTHTFPLRSPPLLHSVYLPPSPLGPSALSSSSSRSSQSASSSASPKLSFSTTSPADPRLITPLTVLSEQSLAAHRVHMEEVRERYENSLYEQQQRQFSFLREELAKDASRPRPGQYRTTHKLKAGAQRMLIVVHLLARLSVLADALAEDRGRRKLLALIEAEKERQRRERIAIEMKKRRRQMVMSFETLSRSLGRFVLHFRTKCRLGYLSSIRRCLVQTRVQMLFVIRVSQYRQLIINGQRKVASFIQCLSHRMKAIDLMWRYEEAVLLRHHPSKWGDPLKYKRFRFTSKDAEMPLTSTAAEDPDEKAHQVLVEKYGKQIVDPRSEEARNALDEWSVINEVEEESEVEEEKSEEGENADKNSKNEADNTKQNEQGKDGVEEPTNGSAKEGAPVQETKPKKNFTKQKSLRDISSIDVISVVEEFLAVFGSKLQPAKSNSNAASSSTTHLPAVLSKSTSSSSLQHHPGLSRQSSTSSLSHALTRQSSSSSLLESDLSSVSSSSSANPLLNFSLNLSGINIFSKGNATDRNASGNVTSRSANATSRSARGRREGTGGAANPPPSLVPETIRYSIIRNKLTELRKRHYQLTYPKAQKRKDELLGFGSGKRDMFETDVPGFGTDNAASSASLNAAQFDRSRSGDYSKRKIAKDVIIFPLFTLLRYEIRDMVVEGMKKAIEDEQNANSRWGRR
ncbi:uncharacterized protein MONOS_6743 [Monocercomonoides exilis]|uniref:uncharacterized protein n=1 Tax=Monocercomonoides exilis TaxID=2049356 RepID=UPI003559C22F|nr:hypothetical protein MONOS_6743 [Monocercomonoides exilis]|eukprot:MONOS_6743.1-p1 / transcript=MONOS_6743.1 / gene=MONOS_6743 / organism=Monocercomonoides_exilis_PA203 / gene_product=unspecified product / transcript_product=unspecified product / location=Mono_scaffold00218:33420-37769(-) / protein_length=1290 / sequence_SO=supercontig / SO=protein_coding / is_pseudo=false